MASLIPGYGYDIFISYRQKDNKHDGWVTEFVDQLKGELESTFKEEVSVYFDINPHDGLLETHEVGDSLKEKLRCLVFIPIISRTYCDPKSFAWEHEFKAFVEQASQDQFGLKIKLPGGNVASRVLPIRIHDLDIADIKMCEDVLGSVLRGIEFIYTEPGVNRSLTPDDDDKKNLNKTKYRNQINKVALAINEIINGMKTAPEWTRLKDRIDTCIDYPERKKEKYSKRFSRKPIFIFSVAAILIAAAIIFYPRLFKSNTLEKVHSSEERISVAVMPFHNMTGDTTKNIWQNLLQYNLSNALSVTEYLEVRQIEFIDNLIKSRDIINYASLTPAVASSIAKKLDADVFIKGNIGKTGNIIRFDAQVIDTKTGRVLKPFQIDSHITSEMDLHAIDSLSKMIREFLMVSEMKKETSPTNLIYGSATNSPEAYRFYTLGKNAFEKKDYPSARNYLSIALSIDSNYFYASVLIIYSYANTHDFKPTKELTNELYTRRNVFPWDQQIYLDYVHAHYFETPYEAIKFMKQLVDMDNQVPNYHYLLGVNYREIFQYNKAITEFEKALEIYDKWGSKPWWIENYTKLCDVYLKTGRLKQVRRILAMAEKDFPEDPDLIYYQAVWALSSGRKKAADKYLEKYLSIMKETSTPEVTVTTNLANIYWNAKLNDDAEMYFRKASLLDPGSIEYKNNLALFLIDTDRNIKEGLELVEKALESAPDNFDFLDSKGWGLYKQKKYTAALEILQKSWDLRIQNAIYNHQAYLRLEAAKKAAAGQKQEG